jgi:hypothetical protein
VRAGYVVQLLLSRAAAEFDHWPDVFAGAVDAHMLLLLLLVLVLVL